MNNTRYDDGFRESEGVFRYGNYKREAEDIRSVILYFLEQNYEISAIIGHSKGNCSCQSCELELDHISWFINLHTTRNIFFYAKLWEINDNFLLLLKENHLVSFALLLFSEKKTIDHLKTMLDLFEYLKCVYI